MQILLKKYSILLCRNHLISMVLALLAGLFFFLSSTRSDLSTMLVAIGLDITRADFVAALLITSLAALVGALSSKPRSGAIVGAGMAFGLRYLGHFIRTALQPTYDPAGNLEQLNYMALLHRSLTMAALALLGAFIGAAVGGALAQIMFVPPLRLLKMLWQQKFTTTFLAAGTDLSRPSNRVASRTANTINRSLRRGSIVIAYERSAFQPVHLIYAWLKAFAMVALLALSIGSSNLFLYSPDVNLYNVMPAKIHSALPPHGTIITDHFFSHSANQERAFMLYLPPSYNLDQARTKRYPVLYLLHGSPGAAQDWLVAGQANTSADTLIAMGRIPELILVMPDGNGLPGMTSEWADSFNHAQHIETSVSQELVSYVDQHYRTLADAQHRAIGGLSMGGFGAMNIAIHHPDVFHCVMSFGGNYQAEGTVWGNNAAYKQANSPLITIHQNKKAQKLHIYLGAASQDQPYYNDTRQFAHTLDALHITYAFDVLPGHHAWHVWQTQLYHALLWLHWSV